jgi:hypothetical protein
MVDSGDQSNCRRLRKLTFIGFALPLVAVKILRLDNTFLFSTLVLRKNQITIPKVIGVAGRRQERETPEA